MNQDLFETLTGTFLDGTPIDAVSPEERITWSIRDNLTRIFTSRAGLLPHLPDYGLPDITEIYRQMPYGIPKLKEAMETAIAEYEPRLKNVRVIYIEPPATPDQTDAMGQKLKKKPFVFEFTITGEVGKLGRVTFSSTLPSFGSPKVSRMVKKV
jgi:type VI secretion system lysozyme-like protein